MTELLHNNLRRGAGATRASVTTLICLLTRNNPAATQQLNQLLYSRLLAALNSGDQILAPVRSVSKYSRYYHPLTSFIVAIRLWYTDKRM